MNDKRIENEKRNLFNELINLTRGVKAKFSGNKKVITHNDVEIHNLLICWENIINFGLKNSILSNVQELFNSSSHNSLFWTFAYQYLSNDEKKRFNGFKNVSINKIGVNAT